MFTVVGLGADTITRGTADDVLGAEIPFYQIGAEQGFLPEGRMIAPALTHRCGDGTIPDRRGTRPVQALLMGPGGAGRRDRRFQRHGDRHRIRMINTAPDPPSAASRTVRCRSADDRAR